MAEAALMRGLLLCGRVWGVFVVVAEVRTFKVGGRSDTLR
jgi:hypothetical protein